MPLTLALSSHRDNVDCALLTSPAKAFAVMASRPISCLTILALNLSEHGILIAASRPLKFYQIRGRNDPDAAALCAAAFVSGCGRKDPSVTPDGGTTTPACTSEEFGDFGACADSCAESQVCIAACADALSTTCRAAYDALVACLRTAQCAAANSQTCSEANCAAQAADFPAELPQIPPCNPVTSAECEAGDTCTYLPAGDFRVGCRAPGTAAVGEVCGGPIQCAVGACLNNGTTSACTLFCDPDNNTCPNNVLCNQTILGSAFTHCGAPRAVCE